MASIRMSIAVPEWMYKELALGRNNNKSERVQELLMKGFMFEKGISFEKDKKSLNATLCFWGYWDEYDSADVGMHLVCKRMRHSTTGMTVSHYIEQGERMKRNKWKGWTPSQILALAVQRSLSEFKPDKYSKHLLEENIQRRLQEY